MESGVVRREGGYELCQPCIHTMQAIYVGWWRKTSAFMKFGWF